MISFKRVCPLSGEFNTLEIDIDIEALKRWQKGELIQNAMPNLSPDEREFIMTGITPDAWDKAFEEEEDPDQGIESEDKPNA